MKKDKFADVRGKEIVYVPDQGIEVKTFVSGINETSISIHAINQKKYISLLAKRYNMPLKEAKEYFKHPYDYAFCIPHRNDKRLDGAYKKLLKILRSNKNSFTGKDIAEDTSGGTPAQCPF